MKNETEKNNNIITQSPISSDNTPKDTKVLSDENNTLKKSIYKPPVKTKIKCFVLSFLFTIAFALFLVGIFVYGNEFESLMFHAKVPLSDGSSQAVRLCARFSLPSALLVFVLFNLGTRLIFRRKKQLAENSLKRRFKFPLKQLKFIYRFGYLLSVSAIVFSIVFIGIQTNAPKYIEGLARTTTVYEENYVAPQNQNFVFPEKKKNLVYIIVESMESSYASSDVGGLMEENYIPNLTRLAKENISFSDTDKLGGSKPVTGTSWTSAAIVSQSTGIPLTIPLFSKNFGKDGSFLPGAYSLGEVLDNAGYTQTVMLGSKASFAKQKAFYNEHGIDRIFDYYTGTGNEKWDYEVKNVLPNDYYVWWGFEDSKLIEYAKDEMEYLAKGDKPFHLNILTIDTHFYDGYKCGKCPNKYDNQYANVIACTDKQISDFVEWIQNHPNKEISENTVIVITGDHLTMDHSYFDSVEKSVKNRGRRVYNCIINSGLSDKHTKNRQFTSMDMYPTILASLGVKWESDSLGMGVNLFSGSKTLAEKMGIDKLSYELKAQSDFYKKYIMEEDYDSIQLKSEVH